MLILVNEWELAAWRWEWPADLDLDFETFLLLSYSFDLDLGSSYCLDFLDGDEELLDLFSRFTGRCLLPSFSLRVI